jgi:hypothetical protein
MPKKPWMKSNSAIADNLQTLLPNPEAGRVSAFASPIKRLVHKSGIPGVIDYCKFQITNHKYQTNNNDRNSKFQTTQK